MKCIQLELTKKLTSSAYVRLNSDPWLNIKAVCGYGVLDKLIGCLDHFSLGYYIRGEVENGKFD